MQCLANFFLENRNVTDLKLNELFLAELNREAGGTRKALERVPEGQNDWRPHAKSMPLGYLASLVAAMHEWIDFMVNRDELDFAPAGEKSGNAEGLDDPGATDDEI